MKITQIETRVVDIAYKPEFNKDERYYVKGYETGKKTDEWIQRNVVVFVDTDSGLRGVGEAALSPGIFGQTWGGTIAAINLYKQQLIGLDPFDLVRAHHVMERMTLIGNYAARAAIDMALHDIMGQAMKVPVYEILGGKTHDSFRTHVSPPITDHVVEDMRRLAEAGFSVFKVKMSGELLKDRRRCLQLVSAFDENVLIHIDPNQGWGVYETIQICDDIYRHPDYKHNFLLEQPVSVHDLDGLAYVTSHVGIPIIADEAASTPQDVLNVVKKRAADIVNIKLTKAGGLHPARQAIAIAEAANVPYIVDEINEMHICNTAVAHLATAAKQIVYGGCTCHLLLVRDVVKKGGVVVKDGRGSVPETPGLGIEELDDEMLIRVD